MPLFITDAWRYAGAQRATPRRLPCATKVKVHVYSGRPSAAPCSPRPFYALSPYTLRKHAPPDACRLRRRVPTFYVTAKCRYKRRCRKAEVRQRYITEDIAIRLIFSRRQQDDGSVAFMLFSADMRPSRSRLTRVAYVCRHMRCRLRCRAAVRESTLICDEYEMRR